MFSHATVGTADLRVARGFYEPLMQALGSELKFADERWAGWKSPAADRPLFIVMAPYDGQPPSTGNGQMIAFLAERRTDVDLCHALAIRHGGTCEGKPGLRPEYHASYYGAYVRDPDGNKLCFCCHRAE